MPRYGRRASRRARSTPNTLNAQRAVLQRRGVVESDEPSYRPPDDPGIRALMASPQYRAAMMELGGRMVDAAKEAAPHDSGDLEESISCEMTPQGSLIVSVDVPYGVYVDQGTARTPAVPFLSGAALDVSA